MYQDIFWILFEIIYEIFNPYLLSFFDCISTEQWLQYWIYWFTNIFNENYFSIWYTSLNRLQITREERKGSLLKYSTKRRPIDSGFCILRCIISSGLNGQTILNLLTKERELTPFDLNGQQSRIRISFWSIWYPAAEDRLSKANVGSLSG